ncbi:hypothetical protein RUM44_002103 [Polyplax serrata]|uniref:Uncharacterized protein n=1 Tax=Polyplax serrata TaxID=468196 RepID=A0ABR1ANN9_POLSC
MSTPRVGQLNRRSSSSDRLRSNLVVNAPEWMSTFEWDDNGKSVYELWDMENTQGALLTQWPFAAEAGQGQALTVLCSLE